MLWNLIKFQPVSCFSNLSQHVTESNARCFINCHQFHLQLLNFSRPWSKTLSFRIDLNEFCHLHEYGWVNKILRGSHNPLKCALIKVASSWRQIWDKKKERRQADLYGFIWLGERGYLVLHKRILGCYGFFSFKNWYLFVSQGMNNAYVWRVSHILYEKSVITRNKSLLIASYFNRIHLLIV